MLEEPQMLIRMPLRALDGIVFEERAIDGAVGGFDRAIRAGGDGGAHDGVALPLHDGADVGEVAVDDAGHRDDVADALHGLAQDVVRDAKRLEEAGSRFHGFQQPLVGNHDDRVDAADQLRESACSACCCAACLRTRTAW